MSVWRYAILDKGEYFEVCEEYLNDDGTHMAYAEGAPGSDTPEELISTLKMVLKDIKSAVKEGRVVKEFKADSE